MLMFLKTQVPPIVRDRSLHGLEAKTCSPRKQLAVKRISAPHQCKLAEPGEQLWKNILKMFNEAGPNKRLDLLRIVDSQLGLNVLASEGVITMLDLVNWLCWLVPGFNSSQELVSLTDLRGKVGVGGRD